MRNLKAVSNRGRKPVGKRAGFDITRFFVQRPVRRTYKRKRHPHRRN